MVSNSLPQLLGYLLIAKDCYAPRISLNRIAITAMTNKI